MKSLVMMILLTTLMISCGPEKDTDPQEESAYTMKCERVSERARTVRCENLEVICYKSGFSYDAGIDCYFKQSLKTKDGLDALNSIINLTK